MPDAHAQIDGGAAYDLIEKSSYGKGVLAVVSEVGDVLWKGTGYYTLAQNLDIEKIYLLVTSSSQAGGLAELVQQGKVALWVNTGKGDENIVIAYGDATVVNDTSAQEDLLKDFVLALPDEDVQALSAESTLPEGACILKLVPTLIKLRKDTADQRALVSAYEAASS